MAKQLNLSQELRIALRYKSTNVPGPAAERAKRVATDFASNHLERPFDYNRDFIHLPSDFDCSEPKTIWILCDFNVQKPIDYVKAIPFEGWKVNYNSEHMP